VRKSELCVRTTLDFGPFVFFFLKREKKKEKEGKASPEDWKLF